MRVKHEHAYQYLPNICYYILLLTALQFITGIQWALKVFHNKFSTLCQYHPVLFLNIMVVHRSLKCCYLQKETMHTVCIKWKCFQGQNSLHYVYMCINIFVCLCVCVYVFICSPYMYACICMFVWHVFLMLILPKDLMLWNSDFPAFLTAIHNAKKILHYNLVHTHTEGHTYTTKTKVS